MLHRTTLTQKDDEDDEGVLELFEQSREESVAKGEGLPEHDEYHDEDESSDYDLDGLSGMGFTMK